MVKRKQYIESIVENTQAMRRKFIIQNRAKWKGGKLPKNPITPSQWAVLGIVMKKGKVSVKEIAEALSISSSAATQLVNGLMRKQCLIREENTKDRRTLSLSLSDKYKKRMTKFRAEAIRSFSVMFEVLNDKELVQYANLNKKIAEAIFKK